MIVEPVISSVEKTHQAREIERALSTRYSKNMISTIWALAEDQSLPGRCCND